MREKVDFSIIGGGIVGLSVAYNLLIKFPNTKVVIFEKESRIAYHQTGHNSGVIHSGIYYKPNSLKALNCQAGYHRLLQFCDNNSIPYNITGKIIACREQDNIEQLNLLLERGEQNGLKNLKMLTSSEIKNIEPNLAVKLGILVPETGVIDFTKVAEVLAGKVKSMGGKILTYHTVKEINTSGEILFKNQKKIVDSSHIITCSGVQSDRILPNLAKQEGLKILPFRGEYYKLSPKAAKLVKALVYPLPDLKFPFLGVHFTKKIDGLVEIGPNAIPSMSREGYKSKFSFNLKDTIDTLSFPGFWRFSSKHIKEGLVEIKKSLSKSAFTKEVNSFFPQISTSDILYSRSGIRAQLCDSNGKLIDDFLIIKKDKLSAVFNAPSPAATSCLSIGEYIVNNI